MGIKFLVVENRDNKFTNVCYSSLKNTELDFAVLTSTNSTAEFNDFCNRYIHLSPNSKEFEIICFRRYFILKKYLDENKDVDRFILLDSDVIVYKGVLNHVSEISKGQGFMGSVDYNFDMDKQVSPHFSYWTRECLSNFVEYLLNAYKKEDIKSKLIEIQKNFAMRGRYGGVSDMTLLYMWSRENKLIKNINSIASGGVVDHNIGCGCDGDHVKFKKIWGVKQVHFSKGCAYVKIEKNNELIPCYAIHFQGKAKILMESAFSNKKYKFYVLVLLLFFARQLKRYAV
jgi:hypothetical protein